VLGQWWNGFAWIVKVTCHNGLWKLTGGHALRLAGCWKPISAAESEPQALKRGWLKNLTARLKSCPSQSLPGTEFFQQPTRSP